MVTSRGLRQKRKEKRRHQGHQRWERKMVGVKTRKEEEKEDDKDEKRRRNPSRSSVDDYQWSAQVMKSINLKPKTLHHLIPMSTLVASWSSLPRVDWSSTGSFWWYPSISSRKYFSKYFETAEGILEEAAYLSGLTIEVPKNDLILIWPLFSRPWKLSTFPDFHIHCRYQ